MLVTDSGALRTGERQHRRRSQACAASEEQARSTQHSRRRSLSCGVVLDDGDIDSYPPSPSLPTPSAPGPGLAHTTARSQFPDLRLRAVNVPNVLNALNAPRASPGAQVHRARPPGTAGGSAPPPGTCRTGSLACTPGVAVDVAATGHIKSNQNQITINEKEERK